MNERIKELAKQCYETGPIGKDGWPEYSRFNEEKFAELIVRECTATLFDESERLSGLSLNDVNWNYALEYEVCSNQCINDIALIEKHFGVKE